MSAEKEIRDVLVADSGVTDLVSTRIYPGKLPQGATLPAVVFQRSATAPVNSTSGDTSSLDQVRMQLDCYASSALAASNVISAIRAAMRSNSRYLYIEERDFDYDDETETYRRQVEFYIWHTGD